MSIDELVPGNVFLNPPLSAEEAAQRVVELGGPDLRGLHAATFLSAGQLNQALVETGWKTKLVNHLDGGVASSVVINASEGGVRCTILVVENMRVAKVAVVQVSVSNKASEEAKERQARFDELNA